MVKFYTSNYSYDYPFPAVSLAYFLRYPNPHSTHVLSTDVISRQYDPETQRLYTTRLHLKQSRLPSAVMKLLPKNILSGGPGRGANGEAQNFILEKSVVDVREGWMETETRNLAYTGILSVVEKQRFVRPEIDLTADGYATRNIHARNETHRSARTDVATTVTFVSRFGQQKQSIFRRRSSSNNGVDDANKTAAEDDEPKKGIFSSLSMGPLQRTIEATGMQRTRNALVKSKEGMDIVLERMRTGGLSAVLEGMRRDRDSTYAHNGETTRSRGFDQDNIEKPKEAWWRNVWRQGDDGYKPDQDDIDD